MPLRCYINNTSRLSQISRLAAAVPATARKMQRTFRDWSPLARSRLSERLSSCNGSSFIRSSIPLFLSRRFRPLFLAPFLPSRWLPLFSPLLRRFTLLLPRRLLPYRAVACEDSLYQQADTRYPVVHSSGCRTTIWDLHRARWVNIQADSRVVIDVDIPLHTGSPEQASDVTPLFLWSERIRIIRTARSSRHIDR